MVQINISDRNPEMWHLNWTLSFETNLEIKHINSKLSNTYTVVELDPEFNLDTDPRLQIVQAKRSAPTGSWFGLTFLTLNLAPWLRMQHSNAFSLLISSFQSNCTTSKRFGIPHEKYSTCAHYWQMLYSSLTIKKSIDETMPRRCSKTTWSAQVPNNNWQFCGLGMSIPGPDPGSKRSRISDPDPHQRI